MYRIGFSSGTFSLASHYGVYTKSDGASEHAHDLSLKSLLFTERQFLEYQTNSKSR